MATATEGTLPQRPIDIVTVTNHVADRWIERFEDIPFYAAAAYVEQHFRQGFDVPTRNHAEARVHPETGIIMPYELYVSFDADTPGKQNHAHVITAYHHDGRKYGAVVTNYVRYCLECQQYLRSPTMRACECPHCGAEPAHTEPMDDHLPQGREQESPSCG